MIGIRLSDDEKKLVEEVAERDGLEVSALVVMMFVRLGILPESSLRKVRHRPVEPYNALYWLLGTICKAQDNCKKLATALPDTEGLGRVYACFTGASKSVIRALRGRKIRKGVDLYHLQADLAKLDDRLNHIVKSIKTGRPDLTRLPDTLSKISHAADAITTALTGPSVQDSALSETGVKTISPVDDSDDLLEKAMEEMRVNMRKAGTK